MKPQLSVDLICMLCQKDALDPLLHPASVDQGHIVLVLSALKKNLKLAIITEW